MTKIFNNIFTYKKYFLPVLVTSIIITIITFYIPFITSHIINVGLHQLKNGIINNIQNEQWNFIFNYSLIMISCSIVLGLSIFFNNFFANLISIKIVKELREKLFSKLLDLSNTEINKFTNESIINRLTNDTSIVQNMYYMLVQQFFTFPLYIIIGIFFIILLAPSLLWIFVLILLIAAVVAFLLFKFTRPIFSKTQYILDKINSKTRQIIKGIYITKSYNQENTEILEFENINNKLFRLQYFSGKLLSIIMPLTTLGINIIGLIIILFGGIYVNFGNLQAGNIIALLSYVSTIFATIISFGMFISSLPSSIVSYNRINEILQISNKSISNNAIKSKCTFYNKFVIDLQNVSYKFKDNKFCLNDINLKILNNKTYGIIGLPGSGKTTLLKLILGLYEPTKGQIIIDGINKNKIDIQSYNTNFAYCPQDSFLFYDTVLNNITYGINNQKKISPSLLNKAIKIAKADEFIALNHEQEKKIFNSTIYQGSKNISGGQRQRLSIARAIASDRQIMVFDDSFSSIDYKTEKLIKKQMKDLKNKTIIISSTRASSIIDADEIIVLDKGKIVGIGSHDKLIKTCNKYKQINKISN